MSSTSEIISTTNHRPFFLPKRSWKYYQEWHDTIFLHYKVPEEILKPLLPDNLSVDTFNGEAWVSITAFTVEKMRLRWLTSFPYLSEFNEVNLRTYVIKYGIPGIYFLTIEAERLIPVLMARSLIGLHYSKARIFRKTYRYEVRKSPEENHLQLKYLPLPEIFAKTALDLWLTERYCAYAVINGQMYRFNIHHKPWHLKKIKIRKLHGAYSKGELTINNRMPDLQHFAPLQKVLLWGREKC